MERFGRTSNDDLNKKRLESQATKTLCANKASAKILKDYLQEKKQDINFEEFSEQRLDECLSHFYVDARKADGTHYKGTTLEAIRHGINRYLKSPPFNKSFDITKDANFRMSMSCFKAAKSEIKQMGKGSIQHYNAISADDRRALYVSMQMNPSTPSGLYNKVQFDIRLYFCRRGAENMHGMTKDTFTVKCDSESGLKYVEKSIDELSKNHRENDKEITSGLMPESPGSLYCPVASFEKYITKLHPDCDRLWQRPRESFSDNDTTWFYNKGVGEKKLKSFMSDLSVSCRLSQVYTNHSIRATGATILSKSKFGAAQIMSVTGHKSVQSLSVYQRVDKEEKVQMGQSISASVQPAGQLALPPVPTQSVLPTRSVPMQPVLPSTAARPALPPIPPVGMEVDTPRQNEASVPYLEGIDIQDLFNDFGPMTNNSLQLQRTDRPQMFNNCQVTIIQNLTINK